MTKLTKQYKGALSQVLAEIEAKILMDVYDKAPYPEVLLLDEACHIINEEVEKRMLEVKIELPQPEANDHKNELVERIYNSLTEEEKSQLLKFWGR